MGQVSTSRGCRTRCFLHKVVEAHRNLQKETGLLDGTKGSMYEQEASALTA